MLGKRNPEPLMISIWPAAGDAGYRWEGDTLYKYG